VFFVVRIFFLIFLNQYLFFSGYSNSIYLRDYTAYFSKSKTVHVVEGSDLDSKGYYKKYVIYATQVTNINTTTETSGKVVDFKYTQQPNKGIIYPNNLNNCDGNTDNDQDVTVGETKFKLSTDAKGNITVESTWKKSTKCSSCDEKAEEILQQTLSKARQASGGKLTEKSIIVGKTKKDFGKLGSLDYADVDLKTFLKNLATMYNSLLDKAQVPTEVWQEGKTFSVKDGTSGVISGVIDESAETYKDIPAIIGIGLTMVSDPEKTYENLKSFATTLDWSKAKELGKSVAKGTVRYDDFSKGGNIALYATGRMTIVATKTVIAGATLLAKIKNTPEALKKKLDEVGDVLTAEGKFIDKLLEADYTKYLARKSAQNKMPKGRLDWKEASDYFKYNSPIARGNAFNKKAEQLFNVNELNLKVDGNNVRVDSYVPPRINSEGKLISEGKIISRKATDLEDIDIKTFEGYLKEMKKKYYPGAKIRSDVYPELDGKLLDGKQYLQIPESNKSFSQLQDYIKLANENDIEIIYLSE
jgi:hypothetical protein